MTMNPIFSIVVLCVCIAIFNELFRRYMLAYKEIEIIVYRIGIFTLLCFTVAFAKYQDMMFMLIVLITISFVEKFKLLFKLLREVFK